MRIGIQETSEGFLPDGTGEGIPPFLDTFLLKGASEPLGGVLILPGGGYALLGDYEGDPVAEKFNALGFHAFVLHYRVSPYRFPVPQTDLVRAVELIRSHAAEWRLGKLAVLGFSAGAHLAASGTMLHEKFSGAGPRGCAGAADAMILGYPVLSLTGEFAHKGSGEVLFGAGAPEAEKSSLNMADHVCADTPPAFLWHTADDDTVHVRNSLEFARRMWACGGTCAVHVFPHGPHGLGLALSRKDVRAWPDLAAEFLTVSAGFIHA